MPATKISAEGALGAAPATNDLLVMVDVSDTTDAASGTTKKMTVANLMTAPTIADFTNANHDHGDADDGGQLTDAALSSAVGIAKGGTGQTTATAAFDALAPTTTAGDTIYHNGSDNIRLAKGTAGQVYKMNAAATAPEWADEGSSLTIFKMQLPFLLWTGSTSGALTTDFLNWDRSSATDIVIPKMGMTADFQSVGSASLLLIQSGGIFYIGANELLQYDNTSNNLTLEFFAQLPASGTGSISMGFAGAASQLTAAYDNTTEQRVVFNLSPAGALYATTCKDAVGMNQTDISSGLTLTNWNHYKIVFDLGTDAKFYVNGTLKATLSGTNLPTGAFDIGLGFGRSDTALFRATAPTLSVSLR